MSKKIKKVLIILFSLFIIIALSIAVHYIAKGAYFCCDQEGKPCVLSPDGDCSAPLQWCSVTKKLDDGTIVCSQW